MECPGILGYRDGGRPCEYTYEKNFDWGIRQMLTNRQPSTGIITFLLQLLVSHQKRHPPFSHNSPDDGEQQPSLSRQTMAESDTDYVKWASP